MLFHKKRFELHKVTPLSKGIALVLFISMPFIGFCLGVRYQKLVSGAEIYRLKMENEILKSVEAKFESFK